MIKHLHSASITAILMICVAGTLMQGNTDRGTRIGYQRYRRRHVSKPPCMNGISNDDDSFGSLGTKIRDTEFVFTGKVTAEIPSDEKPDPWKRSAEPEDGSSKFSIRVKRVLKGELPFPDGSSEELVNTNQVTVKVRAVDEPKAFKDCYKRPIRVHHTAIFLAKRIRDDAMMQLTSDPLPLTLRNLDKVNAAVKDMTYKPRPPIIEEPCEKTYCAYGANCVQTPDGLAECQCPTECPAMFTPVCGTDGITYTNHCMMRMKSCREERNTRVQHAGDCDPRSPKRRHRG